MSYLKYQVGYIFPNITRFFFGIFTLILTGVLVADFLDIAYYMVSDDYAPSRLELTLLFTPFILIGAFVIFAEELVEVKIDEEQIRYSYGLWGLKIGSWEKIPRNSRIIMDDYQETYSSDVSELAAVNDVSFEYKLLKAKLFLPDHNNQITLGKGRKKDKLLKKIKPITDVLNIEIEDLTKR